MMMTIPSCTKLIILTITFVVVYCTTTLAVYSDIMSDENIEKEYTVKLSWLNHNTMNIVWENNVADLIYLEEIKNFEGKLLHNTM